MAILNLVLTTLPGQPSYYLVTSETLAKFYSNSMMVVLNSRMRIGLDTSASDGKIETTVSVGRFRTTMGGGVVTNRSHMNPYGGGGRRGEMDTDAYELGEGVMVTREQVVFPDANGGKSEEHSDKAFLVV